MSTWYTQSESDVTLLTQSEEPDKKREAAGGCFESCIWIIVGFDSKYMSVNINGVLNYERSGDDDDLFMCWVHIVYGKVQKSIYFISRITDWWDWHLFYLLDLCFMTGMLIWIMIPENCRHSSHWEAEHMMDPSPSNCQNISENFLKNIWSYFPTR